MSEQYLAAEQRLAALLGWSNITRMGEALIGTPPAGQRAIRGQALAPAWCRSWEACGPLMVAHRITPMEYDNGEPAVRFAIVQAVIAKLEQGANHG